MGGSPPRRGVVTGARGIAAAAALALARAGVEVFVVADDPADCHELTAALGEVGEGCGAGWACADLRGEHAAVSAFEQAVSALGGLDVVVAVAGGSGPRTGDGPLHEVSLEAFEATLALNLTTTFLTAREAIRSFLADGGGSLVLTSSVLACSPSPHHFTTHAYATAKAAIEGLTTALAASYADRSIRVNAVAPGLVRTAMSARVAADPELSAYVRAKQPIAGDLIEAEQVGNAACWLALAGQVTGQVLTVDAGWSVSEPDSAPPAPARRARRPRSGTAGAGAGAAPG